MPEYLFQRSYPRSGWRQGIILNVCGLHRNNEKWYEFSYGILNFYT
jgi:hypothetical protein